jgi:hypothetical protein
MSRESTKWRKKESYYAENQFPWKVSEVTEREPYQGWHRKRREKGVANETNKYEQWSNQIRLMNCTIHSFTKLANVESVTTINHPWHRHSRGVWSKSGKIIYQKSALLVVRQGKNRSSFKHDLANEYINSLGAGKFARDQTQSGKHAALMK